MSSRRVERVNVGVTNSARLGSAPSERSGSAPPGTALTGSARARFVDGPPVAVPASRETGTRARLPTAVLAVPAVASPTTGLDVTGAPPTKGLHLSQPLETYRRCVLQPALRGACARSQSPHPPRARVFWQGSMQRDVSSTVLAARASSLRVAAAHDRGTPEGGPVGGPAPHTRRAAGGASALDRRGVACVTRG